MKKLSYFFVIILAFLMTSVVVDEFNKQYYERISFVHKQIADELDLKMLQGFVQVKEGESVLDVVKRIDAFSEDNGIPVFIRSSDMLANQQTLNLYLNTKDYKLPDNIYIEDGINVNFDDKNETRYYSTDIFDENRADTLEVLSDEFRDGNTYSFVNFKPFYKYVEDYKDSLQMNVVFLTNNIESTKEKLIKEFPGIDSILLDEIVMKSYEEKAMNTNVKLVLITLGILIILLTCEINKNMKNISVRKMHGNSIGQIINSLFGKFFIVIIGCFIISMIASFMFIVGKLTPLSLELAKQLILVVVTFILAYIVLVIFIYGFIKILSTALNMKKRHVNYTLVNMNLVIKLLLMTTIISPFLNIIQEATWSARHLYDIEKYHDNKKYGYSIGWGIENGEEQSYEEIEESRKKSWDIIDSCGGILIDDSQIQSDFGDAIRTIKGEFTIREVGAKVFTSTYVPFIMVNKNYLRDYNIELSDGNILNVNSLKKNTFLIPESRKHIKVQKYAEYTGGEETDIVNLKSGMECYYPGTYSYYKDKTFKDPIILVYTDYNVAMQPTDSNNFVANLDLVQEKLVLAGFKGQFYSVNNNKSLQNYILSLKTELYKGGITIILYTFIMLVFLYQSVYLYMEETKRLISVQYALGHGKISRYSEIIVMNLAPHTFLFMISILFLSIPTKLIFTFCATFMFIEFLFMVYMIKMFERNTVIVVLKGE